jgi:hypothetical protein
MADTINIKEASAHISILKDPFNKENMNGLSIFCSIGWNGQWSYNGTVRFKNGNTQGEQRFEGKDLKDLLLKIENFVETIDQKARI